MCQKLVKPEKRWDSICSESIKSTEPTTSTNIWLSVVFFNTSTKSWMSRRCHKVVFCIKCLHLKLHFRFQQRFVAPSDHTNGNQPTRENFNFNFSKQVRFNDYASGIKDELLRDGSSICCLPYNKAVPSIHIQWPHRSRVHCDDARTVSTKVLKLSWQTTINAAERIHDWWLMNHRTNPILSLIQHKLIQRWKKKN